MKYVLKVVIAIVTLLTPFSVGSFEGQRQQWPCGDLPKLMRKRSGRPVWLSPTQMTRRVVNRVEVKLPSSVRLEGKITANVLIGSDGHVRCVRVRRGHPILKRAVEESVKQWTFKPVLQNGEAVAVFGFLSFYFSN